MGLRTEKTGRVSLSEFGRRLKGIDKYRVRRYGTSLTHVGSQVWGRRIDTLTVHLIGETKV